MTHQTDFFSDNYPRPINLIPKFLCSGLNLFSTHASGAELVHTRNDISRKLNPIPTLPTLRH